MADGRSNGVLDHGPTIHAPKAYVRFGSKADSCSATTHVRFTPNSDRESGHVPMVMSALPQKRTCAAHSLMSAKGQNRSIRFLLRGWWKLPSKPVDISKRRRLI